MFSEVAADAPQDEQDVLVQVEAVRESLSRLGYTPELYPVSLDLKRVLSGLLQIRPDFVFNLVESLGGIGRFLTFPTSLLDHLRIPYSGGTTQALTITTDKIMTKERLRAEKLPTPPWISSNDPVVSAPFFEPPYILKPVWEDASVGIDDDALVMNRDGLADFVRERCGRYGECMLEAYIPGREFNLSVLGGSQGPEVMPAAEMLFQNYSPEQPRIVGYRAKWVEDSFEYQNTIRTFHHPAHDESLVGKMESLALKCWTIFHLRGYARVDFRVDEHDQPWILEVNANPCISPDSGFVAATKEAGYSFDQVIERIIKDSCQEVEHV